MNSPSECWLLIHFSMPSVVKLPDQCDRVWSGWRSATEKRVYLGDGEEWRLAEQNGT